MEKILKLYTYVDGVNDKPFPNKESQVVITSFRSDYKRMGATPTITCSILHNECLDKLWSYNVYTIFNGEKFFIKQIPTSSYDNNDSRYKHELELVSERIILDNVYFYDVVNAGNNDYKPVTNSSTFSFYGDIHEFANRLQNSLNYSKLNYSVVVDKGVSSEPKMISFEDKFFSNVLQEAYNTYDIPYYFIGNEIHIGYTDNFIQYPFKYGCDESLLSIQKQNANYKVVNRVTGVGSSDNIPYYYPNDDEKGESIPLYNGEEGVVSITNSTLYKKLKLDSSFTYYTKKSGNDILVNGDEFTFGDIPYLDTVLGEIVFGNVEYTFSTSKYSPKCNLIVTYLGEDLSYLDVQITKNNDVKYQFDETGEYPISLNQGVYKINVWLKLATSEKELSYNEIINKFKYFRIYLSQQWDEGKTGWVLSKNNNEEYAPLENYGLSFNGTPKEGDRITFFRTSYIRPQMNLMPPIYRETEGDERFYNAVNNTYIDKDTGKFYFFENPYIEGKPKEHIVNFDHIKPSIVGMTNSNGLRIDMFTEFAYDLNDNDEFDESGEKYLHPYFFGKLRRMDGAYGFNLFDHAIEEGEMVISMTSGSCGGCEFIIGVTEDTQKNVVQVDERGELLRDNNGNVIRVGNPQPQQNDTRNNEVWVALKKDINTFGVIMPNAASHYKPSAGDTFVILHIDLPKAYILAAENKLKEELVKYMSQNNSEKFNFSISFSRIFFEEHPEILSQLNENSRIRIEYDNEVYELYVSSYSYSMSDNAALPEIRVDLSDTITIQQNALQNAVSEVKQDVISSVGSINVQMQGFLRRNIDDRTTGSIATDKGIEVGVYESGKRGAVIYEDITNGQTVAEFDKLYVRMKAYFETLEIINASTIGGKQIISPAGSVKCIGVEETDNAYRCYFLAEQDGEKVQNKWIIGDQAYSQMFNAQEGEFNNVYNKYYWRLVTNVSKTTVDFESKKCHYIDLSKSDCDSGSDIPAIGDVLNQRGNRTDLDRMNFIEMSSVDAFSPNITLFHGVNSYSLDGKAYVSYGVDKSTNKAFMDVYGDMYVGDRQNSSYMRYTQENGLEISGTLSIGTKLGDTPLKDLISASSPEGYQEFVEKVTQDIEGLQAQIDGAIESYFFQYDPTLGNYPASEWIANGTEKAHLNDTFTNLANGYSWRWSLDGTTYKWVEITDTATTKALALAGQAKDTADGKRRVFVEQPKTPYDKGDLWSRGSEYPLMICVKTKDKNGVYEASDFDYADNNAKLKEEMQDLVGETKDELNNAIGQAKNEAVNNANAYTDQGKQALQESIDALEQSKANLDAVYTKAEADGKISKVEEDAINAAKAEADAAIAVSETIIKAYADGVVDKEEAARIKQAQENLEAAKKYAEEQAQKAIDEANDTYGYLARALGTEVDGGLLLTSLIQMRDTDQNIMSGINGLTAKGDKSIATWWGGGMYDMFDYYDWDGAKWVAKKNIQIPSNVPSGVIRMDGTGYLAKGKFWWDESGKIYADPTALFLMFDVEDESASLSQTILAMRDKQTEFADMWEFKTDANGRKYLLSKYPLVTQEGITMYSGVGTTIPSIYDGLPIDGTTIYWENGILKAQGGGNEGINEEQLEDYLTTNNYAKKSDIPSLSGYQPLITSSNKLAYSLISGTPTLLSSFTNDSGFITSSALNDYLPLSGGTLTNHLSLGTSDTTANLEYRVHRSGVRGSVGISIDQTYLLNKHTDGIVRLITVGYNGLRFRDGSNEYTVYHSGNFNPSDYLPITGGKIERNNVTLLSINNTGESSIVESGARYEIKGAAKAWIGYNSTYGAAIYNYAKNWWFGLKDDGSLGYSGGIIYHSGNFNPSDYLPINANAVSASKLQTARKIWGQSFDGTENVDGRLDMDSLMFFKKDGLEHGYLGFASSNTNIYLNANSTLFLTGQKSLILNGNSSNGNVGIGTTNPSYRLDVSGTFNASGNSSVGGTLSVSGTSTFKAVLASNVLIDNSQGYNIKTVNGGSIRAVYLDTATLHFGTIDAVGVDTYVTGKQVSLRYGSNAKMGLTLASDGNVNISQNLVVSGSATLKTLSVNGGSLTYDSTNRSWKLNGNLLVTGGIAMYSDGSDIGGGGTGGGGSIDYPLKWGGFSSGSYDGSSTQTIYIPSKLSELTNDALYAKTTDLSGYLPLTGGTLTNLLTLQYSNPRIAFKTSSDEAFGSLGVFSGKLALYTNSDNKYNDIIHSGNYQNYALPLSGGTIDGNVVINGTASGPLNVNTTSTVEVGIPLKMSSVTKGWLGYNSTAGTYLYNNASKHFFGIKDDGSIYYNKGTILYSGNYSSYALPLTGGEISGTGLTPLSVNTTNSAMEIKLYSKNVLKAVLGFSANDGVFLQERTSNDYIGITTEGTPYYYHTKRSTLLHAYNFQNYALPLSGGTLTSTSDTPLVLKRDATNSTVLLSFINNTEALGNIGIMGQSSHVMYKQPIFTDNVNIYQIIHSGNINTQKVERAKYIETMAVNGNGFYGEQYKLFGQWGSDNSSICDWKVTNYEVRVDRAKKLNTARTIWGQSFDGTGNVDGALSDVTALKIDGTYGVWKGSSFTSSLTTTDLAYNATKHIFYTGNVGISTTTPAYKLDVLSASDSLYDFHVYNSTTKSSFYVGNDSLWYGSSKTDETSIVCVCSGTNRDGGGGTNRFVILGDGKVGIGIDKPAYKLEVNGHISASRGIFGSVLVNKGYGDHTGDQTIETSSEGLMLYLQYYHNGGINLCQGGGNVGIGTTNPSYKLEVNGAIRGTSEIIGNIFYFTSKSESRGWFGSPNNTGATDFVLNVYSGGAIRFNTNNAEQMRINSVGNIGIGTATPSSKLHLYSKENTTLRIQSDGSGGDQGAICMKKASGNGLVFAVENRDFIWQTGADSLTGSGTERMRLTSSGNLSIGGNVEISNSLASNALTSTYLVLNSSGNEQYINFYKNNVAKNQIDASDTHFEIFSNKKFSAGSTSWVSSLKIDRSDSYVCIPNQLGVGGENKNYRLYISGTGHINSNFTIGGTLSVDGVSTFKAVIATNVQINNSQAYNIKTNEGGNIRALYLDTGTLHLGTTDASIVDTYVTGNNVHLRYGSSASMGLTLSNSGYVGIGTTKPSFRLDVSGDIATSQYLRVKACSGYGSGMCSMWYNGNNTTLVVDTGISFAHHCDVGSTLSVSSTSTFTGKTTHNGGISASGISSPKYLTNGNYGIWQGSAYTNALTSDDLAYAAVNEHRFFGSINIIGSTSESRFLYINRSTNDGGIILQYNRTNKWQIVNRDAGLSFYDYDRGKYSVEFKHDGVFSFTGNILTSGSITMNSMRSMKNIINENWLSLEELSTIKPTRFTWKDGRDNRIHVGGIADDVMKVLPEVVFKGNDGVLSMDYASAAFVMAASLIQPMTEHERRIANLERENALLKEEIRNLKSA